MASSGRSRTKSAFQYCRMPLKKSASNAELSTGYGIGPTSSALTSATSRNGLIACSPCSGRPLQQVTTAQNTSPWRSSGMNGSGGAICHPKNAPSSPGASWM